MAANTGPYLSQDLMDLKTIDIR